MLLTSPTAGPLLLRPAVAALEGLIVRLPRSNTYVLTNDGQRLASFYTKVHNRLLRPMLAANQPPAPLPVRQALRTIGQAVDDYIDQARITA